ncbi:MAG TPA: pilus assembly protein PilM [bacterium]|nr:pilus assembly protein PilM [bacterium]
MPHRILGIDVGSYSVKVALIERTFKSFAFTEFYERKIQYNELLSPEESAAIAIQGLVDDHNLSWDTACAGFPAQRVTSRLLTFPFGSAKKIDQTVQFEIESYMPFPVDDVVVDYVVVWSTKDASRVMVVYVQKKDLVRELTMLGTVGVDPRFVCVEGIDQVGLVNLGMVPPEGAYAIIDAGHEKCTVTICRGRKLGYTRAISLAGRAITAAIAGRLSVPLDEAERMKIEMGHLPLAGEEEAADELTREVTAAIKGVVDEFLLHLRQTFFTYHETEDVPVEGVYLSGGTSRLPGLDRYLSDALKLNVTFLNCSDFHFTRLDRADAHRHVIPQALALALRGTAGSGADVNLRSGEFAFKGDVEQFGGSVRKVGIVLGLIVFLGLINFSTKYYSATRQIEKLRGDVAALVRQAVPGTPTRAIATPKAAIGLIKSRESEVAERMGQLKSALGFSPLDVLKEISARLPARNELRIEVADLNVAGDRITLSGIVDDFKAVDTVKAALEKSPLFTNISTGDVAKGVKGEVKFKLAMELAASKEPPPQEPRPQPGAKQKPGPGAKVKPAEEEE